MDPDPESVGYRGHLKPPTKKWVSSSGLNDYQQIHRTAWANLAISLSVVNAPATLGVRVEHNRYAEHHRRLARSWPGLHLAVQLCSENVARTAVGQI